MVLYSNLEYFNILQCYIECNKNVKEAMQLYFERYPECNQPGRKTIKRLEYNLKNFGSFTKPRNKKYEKPLTEEDNINVIGYVTAKPCSSTREIENSIGVSRTRALGVLKKHKFKPYKIIKTNFLYENDAQRRLEFCQWYITRNQQEINFCQSIIWTDEAHIASDGIFNRQNNRHWADVNPHDLVAVRRQGRFGFNVWCGLLGNRMIGPFIYDRNLTAAFYLEILQQQLHEFLDNINLQERASLFFQQDGAPAHNARMTVNLLNHTFPNQWIGTHGPIRWPPRSPDLTPMDFFVWGFLKNEIYKKPNRTLNELRDNTESAFRKISNIHIANAIRSISKRCRLCVNNNGKQFEHLL